MKSIDLAELINNIRHDNFDYKSNEGHISAKYENKTTKELLIAHITDVKWDPQHNRVLLILGDLGP